MKMKNLSENLLEIDKFITTHATALAKELHAMSMCEGSPELLKMLRALPAYCAIFGSNSSMAALERMVAKKICNLVAEGFYVERANEVLKYEEGNERD